MTKYIILTDKKIDGLPQDQNILLMSATDFIANRGEIDLRKHKNIKVINLCSDFDYLSKGYYCSLLADAREMRCIPPVSKIVTLNWKRNYQGHMGELNDLLAKSFDEKELEPSTRIYTIMFGRCSDKRLEPVARKLFDLFRFPLLSLEIKLDNKGKWVMSDIEPLSISDLPHQKHEALFDALKSFTGTAWRTKEERHEKYWIGILHDPEEKHAPSDKVALQKFIKAGKDMNIAVELITRNDFSSILEFDALFIRATTAINHFTYRFASKAADEDIPCIDDTNSIIRCCNKVFQYEILESKKIPLPKTWIIDRKNKDDVAQQVSYPVVVKIPDGAFSLGVSKAADRDSFEKAVSELLKKSEIVLAQEFVKSEFDWRIGVLNGEPLYACKYYMAEGHWQIYNHGAKKPSKQYGNHETVAVTDVPKAVLDIATKAAKQIGDGLYGVDLKQSGDKIVVMEVNDNPNIDSGVEDTVLGLELYKKVLRALVGKIEAAGQVTNPTASKDSDKELLLQKGKAKQAVA